MNDRADGASLARAASAIADASRATMLLGMLDGRAWTATELAAHAGVARSTATEHINALVQAGLVAERHQGRHRYLRLADQRTALLLESLAVGIEPAAPQRSLRGAAADQAVRAARTCYNHLAGGLGVRVHDAMAERGLLDLAAPLGLSEAGERWCDDLGVDLDALARSRRPSVLQCLDWTERRDHLAGALGTALLERFFALGWLVRVRDSRAVRVTADGRVAFQDSLGIAPPRAE